MNEPIDVASQVEAEQRVVDAMYANLDAEVSRRHQANRLALAAAVDETGGQYARDVEVERLSERIRQLRSADHSLCFGRIDRSANGETLYIGRVGLRSDTGSLVLIDWRAEAAAPFYSATLASPMGVRRRRHLRVDRRRVIDVTDEILDGTSPAAEDHVGDSPLIAALSSARTGRMREAAATLQAEQDQIVRSPCRGVMVVDGGPGTGKTIVALHRAAYVLYAFPAIGDAGVLVFGPNQRFLSYISEVLPSLGENDVQLATMSDLLGSDATRDEPDDVARLKGRAELADGLSNWVKRHQPCGVPLELSTGDDTVVLDAVLVDAARRQALEGDVGHNRARELFTEYVIDDMVCELEGRTAKAQSEFEEELEALLGINLDKFTGSSHIGDDAGDGEASAGDLGIDWDAVRDDLLGDPALDRAITRVWPRLNAADVVRRFLNDREALAAVLPDVCGDDLASLCARRPHGWSDADLALLDEARALIDGSPETSYGHVIVDEAQQLSEMQWRMLMRRCPSRSMTIVGDLAQAGPTTTVQAWADALYPFVGDRFVHHTLSVNYRATAEILKSAEELLTQIAPDQPRSRSIRHGAQPEILGVTEDNIYSVLDDVLVELKQAHPAEMIGIITTAERAVLLKSDTRQSDATVVAARDARGLEFDTVIIVDPEGIKNASVAGLRDLYVAQTRATKRLLSLQIGGA